MIGHPRNNGQGMLDQQQPGAIGMNRLEHRRHLMLLLQVQPRHHLVEQQVPWLGRERSGHFEALQVRQGEVRRKKIAL